MFHLSAPHIQAVNQRKNLHLLQKTPPPQQIQQVQRRVVQGMFIKNHMLKGVEKTKISKCININIINHFYIFSSLRCTASPGATDSTSSPTNPLRTTVTISIRTLNFQFEIMSSSHFSISSFAKPVEDDVSSLLSEPQKSSIYSDPISQKPKSHRLTGLPPQVIEKSKPKKAPFRSIGSE